MSRRFWNLSLIITIFIILSVAFSLIIPVFNAPDEPFHFEYIRFLAKEKKLPNQTSEALSITTEGFNPPLYYLIGALTLAAISKNKASDIVLHSEQDLIQFYYYPEAGFSERIYPPLNPRYIKWGKGSERNMFLTTSQERFPFSGSIRVIHLLRLISILIAALTVLFIFKTAEALFPEHKSLALLAAGLCAFNPQFTFLSAVLNNDNLVALFSAISLYLLTKLILSEHENPRPRLIMLGAALGLGLISKVNISCLVVISMIGVIYQTLVFYRKSSLGRRLVKVVRNLLFFLMPVGIISGWYFVRSILLYGFDDPLGWKLQAIQNPGLVLPAQIRMQFLTRAFAPGLFTSFWGQFDWLTIKLAGWMYGIYGLISLAGLIGVVMFLSSGVKRKNKREKKTAVCLALFLAAIVLALINLIILNFTFLSAQGRLIFPVMGPLCIFMALGVVAGLKRICRLIGLRQELATLAFLGLLIGLNLYSLIGIIYPVYH